MFSGCSVCNTKQNIQHLTQRAQAIADVPIRSGRHLQLSSDPRSCSSAPHPAPPVSPVPVTTHDAMTTDHANAHTYRMHVWQIRGTRVLDHMLTGRELSNCCNCRCVIDDQLMMHVVSAFMWLTNHEPFGITRPLQVHGREPERAAGHPCAIWHCVVTLSSYIM